MQEKLQGAGRVFILGIGQGGKNDDRLGSAAVKALARKFPAAKNLKIVDAGDAPENYTLDIRRFSPCHVILIDAASGGFDPGTIFLVSETAIVNGAMTSHRPPLSLLIRYIRESIGSPVIVIGVQPASLEPGDTLSATVKTSLSILVRLLTAILLKTGS